jgi:hypothetical protein
MNSGKAEATHRLDASQPPTAGDHLRRDSYRVREHATLLLSDVLPRKLYNHTDHACFRPTPIWSHSQNLETCKRIEASVVLITSATHIEGLQVVVRLALWLDLTTTAPGHEQHMVCFRAIVAYARLHARQSMHVLLIGTSRGDPASTTQALQANPRPCITSLHHAFAPLITVTSVQAANSLQQRAAISLDFALGRARGAFRACPFACPHSPERYIPCP